MQVRPMRPCRACLDSDACLVRCKRASGPAVASVTHPPPGAGFHSYVQDVAPRSAGLVLAITNTCGTLVGIAGNLLTGYMAASRWGYAGIFALTAVLQAVSGAAWLAGAHGQRLDLQPSQP